MLLLLQRLSLRLCVPLSVRLALILVLQTLETVSGLPGEAFSAPLRTIAIRARGDEPCGSYATEEEPEEARRRAAVVKSVHRWWWVRSGRGSAVVETQFGIDVRLNVRRVCVDEVCKVPAHELNSKQGAAADPSRNPWRFYGGLRMCMCAVPVRVEARGENGRLLAQTLGWSRANIRESWNSSIKVGRRRGYSEHNRRLWLVWFWWAEGPFRCGLLQQHSGFHTFCQHVRT